MIALLALLMAAAPNFDSQANDTRALLSSLVAADTSNPPGNEARAVAIGAARLAAEGIAFERFEFAPGRENLIARLKGSGAEKPLLLLAHVDVVNTTGQPWTSPPHQLVEKGGFLVGRGVSDDLGMAAVELETFIALKRQKVPLRRDVILAWTGDEESGGAGIRYTLEHRRELVGDAVLALNEGGGLVLGDDGKLKLVTLQEAEKSYQDFVLAATGTTGHSSVPLADNAISRLATALTKIAAYRFPAHLIPVTREYFEQRASVEKADVAQAMRSIASAKNELPAAALASLERDPVMAANLRTTCVATMVSGGSKENALPSSAQANVNCRILPDESVELVRERLVAAIDDPQVEVRAIKDFGTGGASPSSGEGPEAVKKIVHALHPRVPVVPSMSRGASDSRFLRQAGIAAYGIGPIATSEADSRRAHGIDERIPAASLRDGSEFFWRLVTELAAAR